jgi:DNA polymerase elongation subunit (family B)
MADDRRGSHIKAHRLGAALTPGGFVQLDAQKFLPIAEKAGALAFLDIESSGLRGEYGTAVVVSIRPYQGSSITFTARPGNDKALIKKVRAELHKFPVWVTYYGKGFDVPFLNTRMLRHGIAPLDKHHHIDLYFILRFKTLTARHSQGHLLSWLGTPEQKMSVSANVWADLAKNYDENIGILVERCESDTEGLQALYEKTKHLISEITR